MNAVKRPALKLRACTRCSGDLIPDEDGYTCLQCGAQVDPLRLVAAQPAGVAGSSMGRRLVLAGSHREDEDDAA